MIGSTSAYFEYRAGKSSCWVMLLTIARLRMNSYRISASREADPPPMLLPNPLRMSALLDTSSLRTVNPRVVAYWSTALVYRYHAEVATGSATKMRNANKRPQCRFLGPALTAMGRITIMGSGFLSPPFAGLPPLFFGVLIVGCGSGVLVINMPAFCAC